jgi:diguanylate cyclase (GGDEF)-like protein/PAS domain S-box-containing protein
MPMPTRSRHGAAALPGATSRDRRVVVILGVYLLVVAAIVLSTSTSIADEKGAAVVVNVASRQRALAERYVKDVLLVSHGLAADPADDAAQLVSNADALLRGGVVTAVRGVDEEVDIAPASNDPGIVAKLEQVRRLIDEMVDRGDALLLMDRRDPRYEGAVQELRIAGALLATVSNDAVGTLTEDIEGQFQWLVVIALVLGVLGAASAITMALLLRRIEARNAVTFASLVTNASDLITVVTNDGSIRYQSPSVERLLGVRADDLLGTPFSALIDADDRGRFAGVLANATVETGAAMKAELRLRHADGSERNVETLVTNLGADAAVRGLLLNTRDVTDRRRLEDELQRQAFFDALTGLPNRAVFRDRLAHALARAERTRDRVAIVLLDLDGFKVVNDSLGHDAGDELLVEVGRRLIDACRGGDTVARLGGDEFAILMEDAVSEDAAVALAERMQRALATPFSVKGREAFIGASIGIAFAGGAGAGPEEMIRNADTAMYEAKAGGKNRYAFFHPEMHERTVEFFEVHADLKRALERGELVLHYQPIVDLGEQRVRAVEALVRWNHPTRGLLPPVAFIPIAEESGLIVPLGIWVLGEACRQAAIWRERIPTAADLSINVNLSTRQLLEPDLVERVEEVLRESGLDPTALTLEITEGSLMQDVEQTAAKLRALKVLGVGLALDDFGTGSSALGYLRDFPIDVLKIDKSFVDGMTDGERDASALVRAIIQLARALELGTVAEGIEKPEQVALLQPAHCERGQGFLFAKPLPSDDVEAVLRAARIPGDEELLDRPAP